MGQRNWTLKGPRKNRVCKFRNQEKFAEIFPFEVLFVTSACRSESSSSPSAPLDSSRHEIRCHSSIKFDRLRPFLVIYSVFNAFVPLFAAIEFDTVRLSSNRIIPPRQAEDHSYQVLHKLSTNHYLKTTFSPLCRGSHAQNGQHQGDFGFMQVSLTHFFLSVMRRQE